MEKINSRGELSIFALGGLGEVGKNMYCLEYQNQIFIVDCGILFPEEHLLGVDYVIPDFTFLEQNQDKIVGLFITHGHEDHIGGIPYLLKKVKIPMIYAAGVTVDMIENKLEEYPELLSSVKITEFKGNYTYNFKSVEVSFIRMNHSIPDAFAICFKTPIGKVLHTGDFKIDFTPVGPQAEYEKLTKLGSTGLLALLSDSTNALRDGFTDSERKIGESIKDLFSKIKGRIICATFASNIFRIQQIIEACMENGRHIAFFGRSMEKTIELGQEVGYIKAKKGVIIDASEINDYSQNELCLLCTGSQGEPLAALSRIANGSHKMIKLQPTDTIIFSSSPIPGNQEGINKTINQLFKAGASVITHSIINDTHTTGHASQGELKMLFSLVKPKYFIPIHGEYRMQKVATDLAVETGVKRENTFILENGDVLKISANGAKMSGKVTSGITYIDGSGIGDISGAVIKERKILSDTGMFSVIITIDSKEKTMPIEPQVVSRGFIYMKGSEELTRDFLAYAKNYVANEMKKQKVLNLITLRNNLATELGKYIEEKTQRNPMIIPIFMDLAKGALIEGK